MTGVEGLHVEGAAGEVDCAVEGRTVAGIPRTAPVEIERLASGVGVVGERAGSVKRSGSEGEVDGVEVADGKGAAVLDRGVARVDVAAGGPRGGRAVDDHGLVCSEIVEVGEGTGGFERAGGEGKVAAAGVEVGGFNGAAIKGGGGGERAAAGKIDCPAGGDIRRVGQGSGHAERSGGEGQVGGVVGSQHGKGAAIEGGRPGQGVIVGHEGAGGNGSSAGVGIGPGKGGGAGADMVNREGAGEVDGGAVGRAVGGEVVVGVGVVEIDGGRAGSAVDEGSVDHAGGGSVSDVERAGAAAVVGECDGQRATGGDGAAVRDGYGPLAAVADT